MPLYKQLRRHGCQHQQLLILTCALSCLTALLSYHKTTETLDWLLYDTVQQFNQLTPANDLLVIDIDEKSINALGRWPWSRDVHARLLEQLTKASTAAVVFDIIFPDADQSNSAGDQLFAQAIAQHGRVILPLFIKQNGFLGQVQEVPPASLFYQSARSLGHVHVSHDRDGVVRSVFLKEGVGSPYWPHISLALWQLLEPQSSSLPGSHYDIDTHIDNPHIIARNYQNYLPMPGPQQGLLHHSYIDVLTGAVDPKSLNKKTVFIGATAAGLSDTLITSVGSISGVELNAWIFHALRNKAFIQELSNIMTVLLNSILVLVLLLVLGRLSPRAFLITNLCAVTSLMIISATLQLGLHRWLPIMPAVIAVIIFYPLWSWRRLEIALDFLRKELNDFSELASQKQLDNKKDFSRSAEYLQNLGIIKHWYIDSQKPLSSTPGATTDQSSTLDQLSIEKGQTRLVANINTSNTINVNWQQQLNGPQSQKNNIQPTGTELVTQTIERLATIKHRADANKRLIQQSLAQLQDGVVISDLCGRIMFVNQAFNRLTASSPIAHSDLLSVLAPIELDNNHNWPDKLLLLYQNKVAFSIQGSHQLFKKELLCQGHLTNTGGQTEDTIIITLTDVSQLKAAEKTRLEALNFLSHDLRSPMVSVLAIIERQRMALTVDQTILEPIEVLVRKNLDYANKFLQLSRAESLQTSQLHLCDLHSVLDCAQMHAMALIEGKKIKLITKRIDEDAWVMGDDDLLERAVINLLSNAVKYSPVGSTVTLSLISAGDQFQLLVSDQGCGIAQEDLPCLFERFTRSSHHGVMSAGLGLNFVATVAHRHQGTIHVDSIEKQGSTFTLSLNAARLNSHLEQHLDTV